MFDRNCIGAMLIGMATATTAVAQITGDGVGGPNTSRQTTIDVPDINIVVERPGEPVIITVPDIVIATVPPRPAITVPDIVVVTQPEPEPQNPIVVTVPDIVVTTSPGGLFIAVPDIVINTQPAPRPILVAVPDIIILTDPDEDDEDETAEDNREDLSVQTDIAIAPTAQGSATAAPVTTPADDTAFAGAGGGPTDWCQGDYTSHFGQGAGTARGVTIPVGQNLTLPGQVTMLSCGAQLAISIQGQTVTLSRTEGTRDYTGSFGMGDGVARTMTLTCDADFNLRGELTAADSNLTIIRPIWLMRDAAGEMDMAACEPLQ